MQAVAGAAAAFAGCSVPTDATTVDTTVTSRRGLEAAFENLSPGETIWLDGENAPYRTTDWLDVDVDGVTVLGPGTPALVKPADGADVGGIRIGHNQRCRDVTVRGFGFHGNAENQSDAATRLHGIAVRDAANVTLAGNHVRETHPRRHGEGGNGIDVTHRCSGVHVLGNQIHRWGDRAVQFAGSQVVVARNEMTDGLGDAVSCDLRSVDGENHTPQNVLVYGNVLGDAAEGNLTDLSRNTPAESNAGVVSIFGNVGFGAHRSLCHVGGPEQFQRVNVQNNVSVQETGAQDTEQTTKSAGVVVDGAGGRHLSVRNNELYQYSRHGIHVTSDVENVSVQDNTVAAPDRAGIRLHGVTHGQVTDNYVSETGTVGICLDGSSSVAVRGNYVRRPGTVGVVSRNSGTPAGHDIADNYVTGTNPSAASSEPAIRICDSGVRVRGNTIRQHGGRAIRECADGGRNLYENNEAAGDQPWEIQSPESRVQNHTPPLDAHQGLTASADSDTVSVEFDRPYARPPQVTFGRAESPVRTVDYRTDDRGNFVGAEIRVECGDGQFDVFVDGA
jgi:parallel beta-helix repeat protein